ncbi:MAG TPA: 50S ribosomal protein L11 methyltransferase, partial [Acetobacteraceae bacterium]|nr:50S ribosomal protein L11 methyltransferase [Acetobacteraceae bacterium]
MRLETVWLDVPQAAVEAYEEALATACLSVGFFRDEASGFWRLEGVKEAGADEASLATALLLAAAATGTDAALHRRETPVEGWLARTQSGFPEQRIGRRFAVRGTHLPPATALGRITL